MTDKKPLNAVDRLIHSLEFRIETYKKNKASIAKDKNELITKENRKISDATLQLEALKGRRKGKIKNEK